RSLGTVGFNFALPLLMRMEIISSLFHNKKNGCFIAPVIAGIFALFAYSQLNLLTLTSIPAGNRKVEAGASFLLLFSIN
ncbi:MAG: hypothetical protein P9M05_12580, partial [Candidatus Stygibacter australis]|nr:hypothetical protein [Candidatus Stygibacter australis]